MDYKGVQQAFENFEKSLRTGALFVIDEFLNKLADTSPEFSAELTKQDMTVLLKLRDLSQGRVLTFKGGKVTGKDAVETDADAQIIFESKQVAQKVLLGQMAGNMEAFVIASKNGSIMIAGPDQKTLWFTSLMLKAFSFDILYQKNYGVQMPNGEMRYVTGTNGGPLFVYVKDDKIVRITPIDFDADDAEPWTITARGKQFTPPKRTTVTPYSIGWKSLVYSPSRILHPLRRVDFDPNGDRNPQNRGISEYQRISWDEALDIVADEIIRVRQTYGPGTVFGVNSSHHTWGNIGYYQSAMKKFFNLLGATEMLANPDSWEGFAWGAVHHYGGSGRRGATEPFSTVEDCMKNAQMIVFWSADPESTSGNYAGQEGTIRREWVKELGIPVVHIDPYLNSTAAFMGGRWITPKPGTDVAMALAIAHIWLKSGLYDKDYVERCTIGLDKWQDYIFGKTDGVEKTPEWQESITGVPARIVRALAEEWGNKKTYLACGGIHSFGGAVRGSYGTEWARAMVCLMALQGLGNEGINFGGLQMGTPLDTHFWFPGYSDGGLSGDYLASAAGVQLYNRMPQHASQNSEYQRIPRLRIPEAILDGHAEANNYSNSSVHGQFLKVKYPAPGHGEVKFLYKYGGSYFGTQPESNRFAKMYRSDKLEIVVSQSIWMEGETRYADIILPACTNFERWDIGEFASCGGYIDRSYLQNNHRVIHIEHKCIEPLGESKSDYEIFTEITSRLDMGHVFTEGGSDFDWVRRYFNATDLPEAVSWQAFMKKGYYVVPPLPENRRDPLALNWFARGAKRDTPEQIPAPSEFYGKFAEGLQTPSGKFEFESQTLKRYNPNDPERLPICTWIPSWEGPESELYEKYKLQLISPHPKYSYHTMGDGKDSTVNDISEHRMLIDGYRYWIFRMNPTDAQVRGVSHGDVVEVFNDRGSVLFGLEITDRLPPGVVHSYESCSDYQPIGIPGQSPEVNGCVNILTPKRFITKDSHGLSVNACLVEVRKWEGDIGKWKNCMS
ncbi:MAG: molybdopterin-dependent oxidoreductase [Oscillospiraceae bacterium]|nr:molybdopterin-dependent oxidoreductase [Oscillospiraceae bacterium]